MDRPRPVVLTHIADCARFAVAAVEKWLVAVCPVEVRGGVRMGFFVASVARGSEAGSCLRGLACA
eukprot:4165194-Lingulodinium_polyedra.AAC.1